MQRRYTNIKGLTLIEVVLYLALFGMFFLVMVQFFFFIGDSNQLSGESLKVDRAMIFLSQHFEDSFKNGVSVDEINSIFDNDTGKLSMSVKWPGNQTPEDFEYTLTQGVLFAGGTAITRGDLQVTKFLLESIEDNADNLVGVKITIGLSSRGRNPVNKEISNNYLLDL